MSATITTEQLGETVARVLRRKFGDLRCADKRLAKMADATPRAARNWMSGECPPNSATLLTLMRECKELREEIIRMVDVSTE
jgi:hypothetical protein